MSTTGFKPRWIFHHTGGAYSRYRFHGLMDLFYGLFLYKPSFRTVLWAFYGAVFI